MTCSVCADARCLVHCIWCGVDCETPAPLHDPACPHATGVYPVTGVEHCCTCGDRVDVYVIRYPDGSGWGYVTCLGCEALA